MTIKSPIIKKIDDNEIGLKKLKDEISSSKEAKIILSYPIVYIHVWKDRGKYSVYVGESNNIIERTKQHYRAINEKNTWQHNLKTKKADLYIIGHEHFNKSLTLDIESRLIRYLTSVESIKKVNNKNNNPQNEYYTSEEFEEIYRKIWNQLKKLDKNNNNILFPSETEIKASAIYKSSPLHKLTENQKRLKTQIKGVIEDAIKNEKTHQLIFIEGETGTDKTVLNSSLFYEICKSKEIEDNEDLEDNFFKKLNYKLIINHNEQFNTYSQIFSKLLNKGEDLVSKPTPFITHHSKDKPIDVAFIDEAHLLLTQGNQGYSGKNQLQDIIDRSKVMIIMFDPNQILTTSQYWEDQILEKYRKIAQDNNTYFKLENQLRLKAKEALKWINNFTYDGIINKIPKDSNGYEIKVFDTPNLLEKAIKEKATNSKTKLSRLVATYDWPYNLKKDNKGNYWEVIIGNWHKPWNYQLGKKLTKNEKKQIKDLSWAEQSQTINEVGSTFTIQGFDLNYVGVILGPSIKYDGNKIVYEPVKDHYKKTTNRRTLSDGSQKEFSEKLLKNELRVLMTRGIDGLYIYACDEKLREKLKECNKN